MPIKGNSNQLFTYEDKMNRLNEILGRLASNDADLIRRMYLDLCTGFINKSRELERYTNPKIEALERRFAEQVMTDLNLQDGL